MIIHSFRFSKDTDLRPYLRAAEHSVEGLSEDQLSEAEKKVEAQIRHILKPTPISNLTQWRTQRLSKSKALKLALAPVLLAGAAALFLPLTLTQEKSESFQVKGLVDAPSNSCSIRPFQLSVGELELGDNAYLADEGKIYLRTNCRHRMDLEVFEGTTWRKLETLSPQDHILNNEAGAKNFEDLLGKRLRLVGASENSEEFRIERTPLSNRRP